MIVGDRDGVVVIARDRLDGVLAAGEAREAKEQAMFAELAAGATTIDLLGLDVTPIRRP